MQHAYFLPAPVTFSRLVIAGIFWGIASSAFAVSLGRSQGLALLGRPLAVSIPLSLDGADSSLESCVSAEVFFGDNRLENARVRVSVEKTPSSRDALIRIRTTVAVDEPVVTMQVRAGCTQSIEKRFVLLADPVPQQRGAAAPQLDPAREEAVNKPSSPQSPPLVVSPGMRPATGQNRPPAIRNLEGISPATRITPARPAPRSVARLKLEPLDLSLDTSPQLKMSRELSGLPEASAGKRTMAAAWWKALMAEPEDVLREAEKINSIEADLKRLNAESQKNQIAMADLQTQLQRQQRESMWWIGGLLAALVLVISGFALWLLTRGQRRTPWWVKKPTSETHWFSSEPSGLAEAARDSHPADSDLLYSLPPERSGNAVPPARPPRAASRHDSGFRRSTRGGHSDFALSMPHVPRTVNAEELFDVQHQAEFFISVGQYEQAVAVLRSHISESQTSALVYLDLFNLYHQLKRRVEFDELRVEFSHLFNAEIPPFDAYMMVSLGLEAHEAVLSRIVSLWPGPQVLEVIEEAVFREPGGQAEVFGLEAYRELLLLYGVAKDIQQAPSALNSSLLDFDLPALPNVETGLTGSVKHGFEASSDAGVLRRPAKQGKSRAANSKIKDPFSKPRVDIDLNALETEEPFITPGAPGREPTVAHEPLSPSPSPSPSAGGDFANFNLMDFEISSVSSPPDTGKPK